MLKQKKLYSFFLILIFVLFSLSRLHTLRFVFGFPEIRLIGPDSFYHLKRIIYTFEHYPDMLIFDPFLSYPEGDYVPWPPLFDFIGGTIAKIFNHPVYPSVFLAFFFGLITFFLILAAQIKKHVISAITTLSLFSASYVLITNQAGGTIDHHALEVLLLMAFYLTYDKNFKLLYKIPLLSIVVFLSFLNWPGAPLYYAPIFIFNLWQILKGKLAKEHLLAIFFPFLAAGAGIYLYFALSGHDVFPYSFRHLSPFHADFCIYLAALAFIAIQYERKVVPKYLAISLIIIASLFFYKLFFQIFGGLGYLGKTLDIKLMQLVDESQPMFFGKHSFFYDDFMTNLFGYTPFYLLTPYIVYFYWKRRDFSLNFIAFLYFFILTFFQRRLGIFYTPFLTIILGDMALELYKKHHSTFKRYALPFSTLLYLPVFTAICLTLSYDYFSMGSHSIYETMNYLRENTPHKERFSKGETPYGVLCDWSIGHYVVTLGNRPATAHNFITNAKNNKELLYIKALFSKEEKDVVEMMDRYNTPYLIISNLDANIISGWDVISDEPNPYLIREKEFHRPSDRVNELFFYKIYNGQPTKNTRLVFEAYASGVSSNYMAILQRVKGAKLISHEKGIIIVKLVTKNGEIETTYEPEKLENKYVFTIPYSSEKIFDVIVDSIKFVSDKGAKDIIIREEEVINGKERFI